MRRRGRLYVALAATMTLVVGTRLPRQDLLWIGAVVALAAFVSYVGVLRARTTASLAWTRLGAVGTVALLLTPPSSEALLAFVPGVVPALVALVFLHYLLARPDDPAPSVGGGTGRHVLTRERSVMTVALAAVVVLPYFVSLLPDRLASLHALRSSATPLAVAAVVAVPFLVVAGIRHIAQAGRDSSRTGSTEEQEGTR